MSWNPLDWMSTITGIFKDTGDIVKEAVTDKDAQNKILGNLKEIEMTIGKDIYLAALNTKTVPWVDALHKMSRPLLNVVTIVAVVVLMLCGESITPEVAMILGGPNLAYQIIKGKGK